MTEHQIVAMLNQAGKEAWGKEYLAYDVADCHFRAMLASQLVREIHDQLVEDVGADEANGLLESCPADDLLGMSCIAHAVDQDGNMVGLLKSMREWGQMPETFYIAAMQEAEIDRGVKTGTIYTVVNDLLG
jgi:hypothetical protein